MKKLLALVICAITMLIFVSCGLRNAVEVVSFNPSGSVGTLTDINERTKEQAINKYGPNYTYPDF